MRGFTDGHSGRTPDTGRRRRRPRLRVLLLDDRFLSRRGMEIVLSAHDDIEVVGAADRAAGVTGAARQTPDVIILDPSPEAYAQVRREAPNARILMLGAGEDLSDADTGQAPLDRRASAAELASAVRKAGGRTR